MKQVLKRLFSMLLAIAMVLSLLPATAFPVNAAIWEDYVVLSGELGNPITKSEDFYEAYSSSSKYYFNSEFKLLADCSCEETLTQAFGSIKIDLNGFNLTLTQGIEITKGNFTITDSVGGGSLTVSRSNGRAITLDPGDSNEITLTIDGAKVIGGEYLLISSLCELAYFEDSSSVAITVKDATLEGDDLIEAGGNTTVTIEKSTLNAEGVSLLLSNNGMEGPGAVAPTRSAKATVTSSSFSGSIGVSLTRGTELTATGTEEDPCVFTGTFRPLDGRDNSIINITNAVFSGGDSNVYIRDCNGSFTNCAFDAYVDLVSGTTTFDGCTFTDRALNANNGHAICTDCTFENGVIYYLGTASRCGSVIVWEDDTTASIYGQPKLTKNLTIPAGTTYNFITYDNWTGAIPAKLILGAYTVTNNGTILVDGVEHIHSGEETVVKKDGKTHHTKIVCTNCPIDFVGYSNEETHTVNTATGLCTVCEENVAVASLTQGDTTTYYASLQAAVAAITGKATLTLEANSEEINAGTLRLPAQEVTLDLNGKDFSLHGYIYVPSGSKLTFRDSTETQAGKLSQYRLEVDSGGEMLMESGTLHGSNTYTNAMTIYGKLTMTGGNVTHQNADIRGLDIGNGGQVVISGGFVQLLSPAIIWDGPYAESLACEVKISGGSFGKIDAGGYDDLYGSSGIHVTTFLAPGYWYFDADGNKIPDSYYLYELENVTVACGHPVDFEGSTPINCKNPGYCALCGETYGEADPTKHGAIDSTTGNCSVCGEFCATISVTQGSTTLYYKDDIRSVLGAVDALSGSQTVQVKLLTDVTDDIPYIDLTFPAKAVELDLNGKTLNQSNREAGIIISDGGSLTVTDSSPEKTGKLSIAYHFHVPENTTLCLSGGTLIGRNANWQLISISGTFVMTGGAVINEIAEKEAVYSYEGSTVKISGGNVSMLYAFVSSDVVGGNAALGTTLSGGTFGCVIARVSEAGSYEGYLSSILAPGCYFLDAQGNQINVAGYHKAENVTVVCGHTGGNTSDATCQAPAVCSVCGKSYGETVPHSIDNATGLCKYGCGTELAKLSVTAGQTVTYYDDVTMAFAAAFAYNGTDTVTVDLLETVDATSTAVQISKAVLLKLNGKTLNISTLSIDGGSLTVEDTSGGSIVLSSPNGGIHVNTGSFTLNSGTVSASQGNAITVNDGTVTVNGGKVEAAAGHGIYLNVSTATVNITGGTVQSPRDQEYVSMATWKFALYLRSGLGTVSLSGGTFLGGIHIEMGVDNTFRNLRELLAEHYALIYCDTGESIRGMNGTTDDLTVVCAHDWNHEDDLPATCTEKALCGYCGQHYGEVDPDNHSLTLTADDAADTIIQACAFGCDHCEQVKLVVPTNVVYDGTGHPASYEGEIPGTSAFITYYQNGQELNETPTQPGDYTAKLTVNGTSVSADFSIARIAVTPQWLTGMLLEKIYDGTTAVAEFSASDYFDPFNCGFMSEHDVHFEGTAEFASPNAGDQDVIVKITLTGKDAKYYALATDTVTGDGLIHKAPLDILADEKHITYGDDAPELTVTYDGFVNGEDESVLSGKLIITTDYDVTNPEKRCVTNYPIHLDGLESSNYEICFIENLLWVDPAQLDLVMDSQTVIYGDKAPEYTYSYTGLKFDDTAEDVRGIFTLYSDYAVGDPAGSVHLIQVDDYECSNSNYYISGFTAANLFVGKRPVSIEMSGSTEKDYDGTDAVLSSVYLSIGNVLSGDDIRLGFAPLRFSQADVGHNIPVILSGLHLLGEDKDNYYLPDTTVQANIGTIHPLDLAGMDLELQDFLYDGTEHTQTVAPVINGLVPTYTLAGDKATAIGCYTLFVMGTGNFYGVSTNIYYILPDNTDVKELNSTNTTSDNRAALEKALAEVTGADRNLADNYLNDLLDDHIQHCTELLDLLDQAEAAANTPAIQAVAGITPENAQLSDKLNLEKAKVDLEVAKNNHTDNYTGEEWDAINEDLDRVNQALDAIANAEVVDSTLSQLPENVDPEDQAAMDAVEKALLDYEKLSDAEKEIVPQAQREKLEDLLSQLEAIRNAEVIRVYGDDRYSTSLKTADELKAVLGVEKFENIIIARGSSFADALSGSYLANVKHAPILLVKAGIEDTVKAYIRQNLVSGGTVYILGGTEAVSTAMETGLESFNIKRLGGADRYETNLLILQEAGVEGGDILITTGNTYADALSASAVESPILLAGWKLTDAQLALLRTVRGKRIIVGGENAVSAKVEAWIRSTGETVRVAGSDRYETSLLLAKMYFSDPAKAVLVYGDNFPDGISAGPLANALKAPVLLVKDSKADVLAQFNASHSITVGYVLGGQKLLANDTVRTIFDMEANAPIKVCK